MRDFRLWLANRVLDANWPGIWLRIRIARRVAPGRSYPYFTNRRSPSPIGPGNGLLTGAKFPLARPGPSPSTAPAKESPNGEKSTTR